MMFCFIYTSISYYLSAQLMTWTRFLMFLFVCQLMTLISEGIGLILGTAMSPVVSQYEITHKLLLSTNSKLYFRMESLLVQSSLVCVFFSPVSWCFSITCLFFCTMYPTLVIWGMHLKGWLYLFTVMAVNLLTVWMKKHIAISVSRKQHSRKLVWLMESIGQIYQ